MSSDLGRALDVIPIEKNFGKTTPFDRFWKMKQRSNALMLDAVTNGLIDVVQKLINPLNPVDETAEVRCCEINGLGAIHLAIIHKRF